MHSASENKRVLVEDLSTVQNGTETIQQWTPSIVDNTSQKQPGSDNRDTPELATTPLQPNNESTNPQSPEGERMNWEDDPTHKDSTEMLKGNQLLDLQPRPAKISTTPGESSSGSTGTEHRSDGTLTTERAEKEISFPQDPETLYPTSQASREVMLKSERGKQAQVPDPPDTPLASKEMTSKFRGLSSGDTMASQVLCVHLPAGGISMEQQQGPWLPTNISRRSQNKAFPPATKTRGAQATEAGKLGGGNAGLETSQTRGRRRTVQVKTPEEIRRCTSSPAQTAKRQPSPESHITNQIKSFWQWLSPGRKHKGQEKSLAKGGSPLPSAKGKSLIKRREDFCGNTEAQKCLRDTELVLRKQGGHKHGAAPPSPQTPLSFLKKSEKTQHEVPLQAQAAMSRAVPSTPKLPSLSQGQRRMPPENRGIAEKATVLETYPICDPEGTGVPSKTHQ